jgi:uncharacterized protein (TIGR03492 family)
MDEERILFLSNGHGEDVCGAIIAQELRDKGITNLCAMPIVGVGEAYTKVGIKVKGPQRKLPCGGAIYGRPGAMMKEISGGLLELIFKQRRYLKREAANFTHVVAVGDVVPLLFNRLWLKKPIYYVAIAKSAYYEGGRFPIMDREELWALRGYARRVFFRDRFTYQCALRQCSDLDLVFLGNPMMDSLAKDGGSFKDLPSPVITLLPGSREVAYKNLDRLLAVAKLIARRKTSFLVSRAQELDPQRMHRIITARGWTKEEGLYKMGNCSLILTDKFADSLFRAQLVIGLAGTANEQAAGLGKPVVSFPADEKRFSRLFLDAQSRLLGKALRPVYSTDPDLIAKEVLAILANPAGYRAMAQEGIEHMGGGPGAGERIAQSIVTDLLKLNSNQLKNA